MTTIDELWKRSPLPPRVLSEVEMRFEHMLRERRAADKEVRMGSFAEDEPFLHFLHASDHEQVRVAREVLGIEWDDLEATA